VGVYRVDFIGGTLVSVLLRKCIASLVAGVALLASRAALATTTEPNGIVVPRDSANGEIQLYTFFQQRGEAIQWQNDASPKPDVFSPLCNFKAAYLLNQAGSHFGLAWYNVDPTATTPPTGGLLHQIVAPNSPLGTVFTGTDIKKDPAYAGGLIGFALIGGQTHYSEAKWNVVCSGCSSPGPWILSVTYKSSVLPDAYYLAFEDGNVTSSSYANDGDYNDDVYLLQGLQCVGGGQPCDTGQQGICAQGVTQCSSGGATNCTQTVQPIAEKCDGLDNDCNGQVDDGQGLCQTDYVCDRGTCVKACGSGEFSCSGNKVCSNGYCVDPSCASVSCPSGQVCVKGQCKAPCDGVTCPTGQQCRVGACVDPCSGVTCPSGQVCNAGACGPPCTCAPCPTGLSCDSANGKCVDPGCEGKQCASGQVCKAGQCVDPCAGAVCPSGQLCQSGQCVDNPNGSGGASGGSGGDGGLVIGSGGTGASSAGGNSSGGNGAGGQPSRGDTSAGSNGGCGCRVASTDSLPRGGLLLFGLLGFGWGWRRRRRS
jgi:MYXO-CTERM domain-containing protein